MFRKMVTHDVFRIFSAEFIGTAVLMFIGCMGCVAGMYYNFSFHFACVSWGFAVLIPIQMISHISGAHLNPTVTIGAVIMRQIKPHLVPVYIIAEFSGAIAGFGTLVLVTPKRAMTKTYFDENLNETVTKPGVCSTVVNKDVALWQAFIIEFIIAALLILCICAVWDKRTTVTHGPFLHLRLTFALIGLFLTAAPYTGASLNTARSLAPAIFNNDWQNHWLYWISPNLGGFVSSYAYWFFCVYMQKDTQAEIV